MVQVVEVMCVDYKQKLQKIDEPNNVYPVRGSAVWFPFFRLLILRIVGTTHFHFQALIHRHISPHASPFHYLLVHIISCLIHTPHGTKSVCECGNNRCCVPGSPSKRGMKWGDDDSMCLTVLGRSVWAAWKCSLSLIHYTILLSCMLDYKLDVV